MMRLICKWLEKILGFGRLLKARREKDEGVIFDGEISCRH